MAEPASTGFCTNFINISLSFSSAIFRKLTRPILPEALNILAIAPRGDEPAGSGEEIGLLGSDFGFFNRENVLRSIFFSLVNADLF
jgi:hypothetical protein